MTAPLPSTDERPIPLIVAAGLTVVATIAIYWPAVGVGFLGDDFMILHRLRGLAHPADASRFFRGEFFEYYRPLGFVSHAIDWFIAGQNPREFHLTNLLVHVVNSILVLLIGRQLSPRPLAGLLAAALFALHASNNEAVVWISARFDLLATCFALGALYWMVRGDAVSRLGAPLLFFLALLSKEAAVALPIAAAAWSAFRLRTTTWKTATFVVPWLVALAAYSTLRNLAGGVSAVGGASRVPKLAAFIFCVIAICGLSSERWTRLRDWLTPRRNLFVAVALPTISAVTFAAWISHGRVGALAREKLAVAGFATFYSVSPVLAPGEAVFSDPESAPAWIVGSIALVGISVALFLMWRTLLDDDRSWFFAALLIATMLPISALTEGKRYLYLPSAAMSLIIAIMVVELYGRSRRVALATVAAVLVVSSIQIGTRLQDWRWAGQMTAEGAQLVDAALAPSCNTGHVVFITSPVGMRGVYSHFYYETFEIPRGCMPEFFQVVARVLRVDSPIEVKWDGQRQIVVTTTDYRGNFLLSEDLRSFDAPLRRGETTTLQTPLGRLEARASDGTAQLTLTLSPQVGQQPVHFFYYADGRIQPLAPSP